MIKLRQKFSNPIVFSLTVNTLLLLISIFLFHPFFEENDDAFLAMIAEGAYGARESRLIYVSSLLGRLMTLLYSVLPVVRWHCVLQYAFLFLAYSAVTAVLCRRRHGKLLSILLLLCTFYESYVSLQYTKTAAIVTAAGFVLLFESLRRKRKEGRIPVAPIVTGDFLLIYGALLRSSAFLLASVLLLCAGLYELYGCYKESGKNEFPKKLLNYAAVFVPILCLIFLLFAFDRQGYKTDGNWNTFMEYNDTRTALLDYRYDLLDYSFNSEYLKSFGISENDTMLYLTWQFGDDRVLSTELMKDVLTGAQPRAVDGVLFKAFASNLFEELYSLSALVPGLFCVLVLLALSAFAGDKREKTPFFLYLLLCACLLSVILFYYQYSGRWNHRVVSALFLVLLPVFFFECPEHKREDTGTEKEKQGILPAGLLAVMLVIFFNIGLLLENQFAYRAYQREEPDYAAQLAAINEEKETLFVLDMFTFQRAYQYEVFTAYPVGLLDNAVLAGSWYVNSPITRAVTQRYGYSNPFEALEKGDGDVILLDNCYPKEKAQYLSEHTGETFQAVYEKTENGFDRYRIKETGK
ncbi:MAG: hypothetical protein QM697_01270 [Lachnospiraceae bacterium]